MRIAVLWTRLSGYLNACLKELAGREGVNLLVIHEAASEEAPFDARQFDWITDRIEWRTMRELESLSDRVRAFAPEIMLMPSWHVAPYRKLGREFSGKCWRVMAMDNPWQGTLRQRAGTWIAPYFVHPIADAVWLPGERQAVFARKLGFRQEQILRGMFTCDQPAFAAVHQTRVREGRPVQRTFLFVGRFSPEKGIDVLARAYRHYRDLTPKPWSLVCCGAGPMRSCLEGIDGIRVMGFVQPAEIASVFGAAGCFVLPSRLEPWALVVHEAASAGLLILASEEVGATPHLVQPGYNGFICSKGDEKELAGLMSRVSAMSNLRLDEMSRSSHLLSYQYSPRRWADTLLSSFGALARDREAVEASAALAR